MDDENILEWAHELYDAILKDEAKAIGDNEIAVQRMKKSESILKEIVSGSGITIDVQRNAPLPSMGVISVLGKEIKFSDTSSFFVVAKLVSNIDVYSENGAVVRIDFTFHGLTRKGGMDSGFHRVL